MAEINVSLWRVVDYGFEEALAATGRSWREFAEWADRWLEVWRRWGRGGRSELTTTYKNGFHTGIYSLDLDFGAEARANLWEIGHEAVVAREVADVLGQVLDSCKDKGVRFGVPLTELPFTRADLRKPEKLIRNWGYVEHLLFRVTMALKGGRIAAPDLESRELRWLRWASRGESNHVRAFWVLVREALSQQLQEMRPLHEAVASRVPPERSSLSNLRWFERLGTTETEVRQNNDGAITPYLVSRPDLFRISKMPFGLVRSRAYALAVPVAWSLSDELMASQKWPRFEVVCRNPFCGKRFFAPRKTDRTCPRRPGQGRRSDCKKAWDEFQKWLKKIERDPDSDWQDADLAEAFKQQYKPRGPQPRDR